jgi:hypothetical protein
MSPVVMAQIRRAGPSDAEHIAAAHLDSIRTVGARFYSADIVEDWVARISPERYVKAMEGGETFYVALGSIDDRPCALGFSSHRVEDGRHRTAIYIRGRVVRSGFGSSLFRLAQSLAIAGGATSIRVDSSLAAVDFYLANGFEVIGRGSHQLWSGRSMDCVFMEKTLEKLLPRTD